MGFTFGLKPFEAVEKVFWRGQSRLRETKNQQLSYALGE